MSTKNKKSRLNTRKRVNITLTEQAFDAIALLPEWISVGRFLGFVLCGNTNIYVRPVLSGTTTANKRTVENSDRLLRAVNAVDSITPAELSETDDNADS
jgi:hypothetical protein